MTAVGEARAPPARPTARRGTRGTRRTPFFSSACRCACAHASGTSIIITCGSERPLATRKSTTLSSDAESEPPGRMIGLKSSMCSPKMLALQQRLARRIQLWLPRSVLISPLCAMRRYGCARSQAGNVLVEKRECTMRERAHGALVGEVGVEAAELLRRASGPCRRPSATSTTRCRSRRRSFGATAPGALADHEERALERVARAHAPDEELAHRRHAMSRAIGPERRAVDGDVAPAEHALAVVHDGRLRGSPAGAGGAPDRARGSTCATP